jgi:hypothetical protein
MKKIKILFTCFIIGNLMEIGLVGLFEWQTGTKAAAGLCAFFLLVINVISLCIAGYLIEQKGETK